MEEKITYSKEDKQTSVFGCIAAGAVFLTNFSYAFTRQEKFSAFLPLSIALCAVSAVLDIIALAVLIKNFKGLTKKINYVIGLVLLTLICGWECYMGVSAVKDMNVKRNAENSAVLFIKDKYGIDAEVVGYSGYTSSYSGDREDTVKMTADGKEFTVKFISSDEYGKHTADDLQADEIKQALFDEVSRAYPNGILRNVGIYNYDFIGFCTVFEKYFNGANLDEVIVNCNGGITVDYADTEFDLEDPLFEKLNKWHIQPYFTSFDTAAHLEEFVEKNEPQTVYRRDEQYAKYAQYITDRVEYNYNKETNEREIIRKSYDIKSYGEFDYFYLWGSDDKYLTKSPEIAEAENGSRDIEKKFANYDESQLIDKPVSDVYEVHGRSGSHFIYCPLENLSASDNIGVAWISYQSAIPDHGVEKASICGDYAVFTLPFDAYEFMMVDTSGYNEDDQR